MEASELLRNITTLPKISVSLAEEMLAGNFSSVFKGQGMEFDEARHYQPGDDIRFIDWNASARFGTPYIKMYREERELTILILMDISPSMHRRNIALQRMSPYEQGLICAALIAFSAEHTGQQVGAFFFDSDLHKVFPPRKGRRHIMAFIMAALQFQNKTPDKGYIRIENRSNIASALKSAQQFLKKRSLVVLISDFFSINWEKEILTLSRKHDVIALRICDPPELPWHGLITLEDPETKVRIEAPAGLASFRESWSQWCNERSTRWMAQCRRNGVSYLEINTTTDAPSAILKFFGRHGRSKPAAGKRR